MHLPKNKETEGWLNAAAFAKMKDGVRILNVARGPLIVDADLQAALDSGKVAGAALDVFRTEPVTDHPLFGYPNVVVTPHLGASTAEATDRAGYQAAEQAVAALTGAAVTSAVNVPVDRARTTSRRSARSWGCARRSARSPARSRPGTSIDGVEVEFLGRIAERDSRLLTIQVVKGLLAGHIEEGVNDVNAFTLAHERDIAIAERSTPQAHDFSDLVRVRAAQRQRDARAWSAPCSDAATGRTCWRRGARGSTCNSSSTWPCSATATSPACSAGSGRRWATRASTSSRRRSAAGPTATATARRS